MFELGQGSGLQPEPQFRPEFALCRAIPFARTPRQKVNGDLANLVASRGRRALLLRLGKFDSRRGYAYGVCPDRCLNGAEKIIISEMLEVELRAPGLNVIEDGRDYKHACTHFVASDLQLS